MAHDLNSERLIWLHSNYCFCNVSQVCFNDMRDKYIERFEKCSQPQFRQIIKQAFPQISVGKKAHLEGLREVDPKDFIIKTDFESVHFLIPSGYFTTSRTETSYEIAKYTGLVCNGCKVMLEIKITSEGICEVSVMGAIIDTGFSAVQLTFHSIRVFFAVLDMLRFCPGIEFDIHVSQQENAFIQFSQDGKVLYSTKCLKTLPFTQSLTEPACSQCEQLKEGAYKEQSRMNCKVAILGASGVIGQPLSLLLKQSPLISHLTLYDLADTPKVAADLNQIQNYPKVSAHLGPEELKACLSEANIVIILAGVPEKAGLTADDLLIKNVSLFKDLCEACAQFCPEAMLLILTNPVNSMVPIASEVFKEHNVYDPDKIFGVTTLNVVRANAFIAEFQGLDVSKVNVPVFGGNSGVTVIPVSSQATPPLSLSEGETIAVTWRLQNADKDIIKVKSFTGSATLSMAYAAARFTTSLIEAIGGAEGKIECAFVRSDVTEAKYFATPVLLGKKGVERNLGLGELTEYEKDVLRKAMPELLSNITKGEHKFYEQ